MRTQSLDTNPDAERMMIHLIRQASMRKRFRLIQSLTQSTMWSNYHTWQQIHEAQEDEAAFHFVSCLYGINLAQHVQTALEQRPFWHLQSPNLLTVILPALDIFEQEHVPYYLGGSLASSLHGMQQAAQDIDLVVDLHERSLPSVFQLLHHHYLFDEHEPLHTPGAHTAFPLIHLDSLMKIDLIFSASDAFDTAMRRFVVNHTLDDRYAPIRVASVSEMILFKLQRYQRNAQTRLDGMQDDAEWNDILGMLKVQGHDLDRPLLEEWARKLGVTGIWQQALLDAGLIEN
jgi:hypothetical protein